jgi:hypothetical protein
LLLAGRGGVRGVSPRQPFACPLPKAGVLEAPALPRPSEREGGSSRFPASLAPASLVRFPRPIPSPDSLPRPLASLASLAHFPRCPLPSLPASLARFPRPLPSLPASLAACFATRFPSLPASLARVLTRAPRTSARPPRSRSRGP